MDLLNAISERIRSEYDWTSIATQIGIDINDIDKIKKKNNCATEFVCALTNKIWNVIFEYTNITTSENGYVNITCIDKLAQILAGHIKNKSNEKKPDVNLLKEIGSRLGKWKEFARILGLEESAINAIEKAFPSPELYIQRTLEVMKKFSHPLPPTTSWEFWRQYLNQFEDGKVVIEEIERNFSSLLAEVSNTGAHMVRSNKLNYYGHTFQYQHLDLFDNKDNIEIIVRLESDGFIDLQNISEWAETKQQYADRYTILQKINSFNYVNVGANECPIVNTLKQYLDYTNDSGFVVKGYHYVDHIRLFKPGAFAKDIFDNHYFCFIVNDGVVLYITFCNKDNNGDALYRSTRNIQIANLLHKELNSCNMLQINVIVHKKNESFDFCKSCENKQLYVTEEMFQDVKTFSCWYEDVIINNVKVKFQSKNNFAFEEINNISESVKRDMFTYEALENIQLPSYSYCKEDQVKELEKMIVLLTPPQMCALYANGNHICIRGTYGSGKSIVLEKRFEKVIVTIDIADVSYLICHDQQSEFYHQMKRVQAKYPEKNIIVCQSKDIIPALTMPKLSTVLKSIKDIWPNKKVHAFLDEFSGSYFDKNEILELKDILNMFQDSHIVVALQSMEESIFSNDSDEDAEIGYQFDFLTQHTSFLMFNFEHSLRSSYEINEFAKATAKIIEFSHRSVAGLKSFHSSGKFIDKEFGMENFNNTEVINKNHGTKMKSKSKVMISYIYNQSDFVSHTVSCGPVKVYYMGKYKLPKSIDKTVIYISVLTHILNDSSIYDKYVVCTYEKKLYNATASFLDSNSFNWTNKISDFLIQNSIYEILLTDYASVRGFEFSKFIFLVPLGYKFLQYRILECLTRATTNLFLITDNYKSVKKRFSKDSDYEFNMNLLDTWRQLDCSRFYDVKYDKYADILMTVDAGDTIVLRKDLKKIVLQTCDIFPWEHGVSLQNSTIENDGVLAVLKNLILMDNSDTCREFLEVNKIDFDTYDDNWKQKLLHFAVKHGAVSILKLLVQSYKFEIDLKDISSPSLLKTAALNKNVYVIELLLHLQADANNKVENRRFIFRNIDDHYKNIVDILLGKMPNSYYYGNFELITAAFRGYMDLAKVLIEMGANMNLTDKFGYTALHAAVQSCDVDIVKLLIHKNANLYISNNEGNLPMHIAVIKNRFDILELLLSKNKSAINETNKVLNGPIHLAVLNNKFEILKMMVENYEGIIDIDMQGSEGRTALYMACMKGRFNIVEYLIGKKANIDISCNKGYTPLHIAIGCSNTNIALMLIDKSKNINIKCHNGLAPLHEAAKIGAIDVVQHLIDKNADINILNNHGLSPLHFAVNHNHVDVVCCLVISNAIVNAKDVYGDTPLHFAVSKNHFDIVKFLVSQNADINIANDEDDTPFHIAAKVGSVETVEFLMNNGADIKVRNNMEETAFDVAVRAKQDNVIEFFKNSGHDFSSGSLLSFL